jgi:alcohol dehydrogenase (NADP+)
MTSEPQFKGFIARSAVPPGHLEWAPLPVKPFATTDIDIEISHCGICGSDIHTLTGGWKNTHYPVCVGHEIVGRAVRVGDAASKTGRIRVGDRVGVGAQSGSCLECEECKAGKESYCGRGNVSTYNSKYPDGSYSMGGYATHSRVDEHFVVRIPEALPSAAAAPMLCGGITVYSPLKKWGAGPGKKVGIVGVGGLGHFGILFARALGADKVVAISRSGKKKADALTLGAHGFIATDEEEKWGRKHARTLDLIISTVSGAKMPLAQYLSLLRTDGTFVQVGAPEDKLPALNAFHFMSKGVKMTGSSIGSPAEIEEMLQFAADKGIRPMIEERPMSEADQAVRDMEDGKARYRYVLVNGEKANL